MRYWWLWAWLAVASLIVLRLDRIWIPLLYSAAFVAVAVAIAWRSP